jgi:TRAP-type mannitol/chloroaromatic compound transport system permease small subunit
VASTHKSSIVDDVIAERRGERGAPMPDDMPRWMALTIRAVDGFTWWCGHAICFLTLPLIAAMVVEIFMRYLFVAPTVWAFDVSRMLYGAMFMLGAAYALLKGAHIRADFLYRGWSHRAQASVDLGLYLVFYFPRLIVFFWFSFEFAQASWMRGERGMDTAWMPPLGPIKTAIPVGIALLLVQGISEVLKCWYAVTRGRWPG